MTRTRRTLLLAAALAAAASPAFAHAHLETARPAAGSTVKISPTQLELHFSEGVNPAFTGVAMTGPGGTVVPTGKAQLGPDGATTLIVPVSKTLAAGAYIVAWHALAVDGHKTDGHYGFTIAP